MLLRNYNSYYAKTTSRPLLAGFGLHRATGSILTLADTYLNAASFCARGSVGQEPVVLEGGFYVFLYPFPDDWHCGSYDVHSLLNGRN